MITKSKQDSKNFQIMYRNVKENQKKEKKIKGHKQTKTKQ